jgi:hypothetical protein
MYCCYAFLVVKVKINVAIPSNKKLTNNKIIVVVVVVVVVAPAAETLAVIHYFRNYPSMV